MEFLLGAAAMLLFFVVFELGKRSATKPQPVPKPMEVDEEQLEKAKRIQAHFEALMSYDVEQAMKKEW